MMDPFIVNKIKSLQDYFHDHQDILMVFLFGSRVGQSHADSDWDIGIYFKPLLGNLEREVREEFAGEKDIYLDLTRILKTDNIDLVVLNRCPAHLADVIVREGHPVLIRDRNLYLDFLLTISGEAQDYRMLMQDYFAIYERSASLSQEDRIRLEKRVIFLETELKDFLYYKEFGLADYEGNVHKKREIERWVENIMNTVLDISKIVLSSHKSEIPETYRDTIEKLSKLGLPDDVIQLLAGWIQLRNILAHEYLDLRWKRIRNFLDQGEEASLRYLKFVKKILS